MGDKKKSNLKWFFKRAHKEAKKIQSLKAEDLVYHALPHFLGEVMAKYFRMEVEGIENIPKKGSGIIVSNHSGYTGFDAFLLCHHIYKTIKRTPRVLTHKFWFMSKATAIPAQKMGFIKAKTKNGLDTLENKKLLLIFPEGENGNFKPTTERYKLQRFKAGAIRMAIETNSPIIPTLVIGAEETHINLAKLKFTKYINFIVPIPLNVIPLPARWKIKFLPPYEINYSLEDLEDEHTIQKINAELRQYMQKEIKKELQNRDWIFL